MISREKFNEGSANHDNKAMAGVGMEDKHYLLVFIQTYRDLPVLWDTSLRDYTNREKRTHAYEELVPIYRYLKRDATVEDVKKKINTLRTNYRKALKLVECERRSSGTTHQPRCWTFHEMDFLRNTEKFLAVNPVPKSDSFAFSESSQASFMDAPSPYFRSPAAQSPPSITEMFQKSFGHPQKLEPQQTPPPPIPSVYTTPHEVVNVKRQRLSPSPVAASNTQNPEELLNIACDYLSGTFPEEESIARTWTHKLKRMQFDQRLLAEKFINEILFEGETGTLHRGSVQINTFEPFVRFEEHAKSQSPSVHTSTSAALSAHEAEPKPLNKPPTISDNNFANYTG